MRRGGKSEAVNKSNQEIKHLKNCFIQTFPPFLRPFYLGALNANASVLTDLTFKSIGRMSAKDWGFLITHVYLPVLRRFAISFSTIPRDAVIKFLSKHSHITSFEYHHIIYRPKTKVGLPGLNNGLNHLEQLTTTSEHILTFLPPMDRMSSLTYVAIDVEGNHMDFNPVEQALRRISSCVNRIELTLHVISTSDLGPKAWLQLLVHLEPSFGRFMVHCVESLRLKNGLWGDAANVLGQLPILLKLFPELKHLILHSVRPNPQVPSLLADHEALLPIFERVKLACPTITSISIQGDSEWTHKYSSWYVQAHPNFYAVY
jgi:hypothetical protein